MGALAVKAQSGTRRCCRALTYTGVKFLGGDCSMQPNMMKPNPTITLATANTFSTRLNTAVSPVLFISGSVYADIRLSWGLSSFGDGGL